MQVPARLPASNGQWDFRRNANGGYGKHAEVPSRCPTLAYLTIVGDKLIWHSGGAKFAGVLGACRGVAQPGSAHAWGA
jgi:hypothetical protein